MHPTPLSTAGASAAAAASAASTPVAQASIPFKPAEGEGAGGVGFPAASVACLVLLAISIVALRRWGAPRLRLAGRTSAVEIVESRRLADRMRVSVIRYRGRELLVAHSDQVATVLAETAAPLTEGGDS